MAQACIAGAASGRSDKLAFNRHPKDTGTTLATRPVYTTQGMDGSATGAPLRKKSNYVKWTPLNQVVVLK